MAMPPDYKGKSIIDKMVACTPQLPSSPSPKDHCSKGEHKFVCKRNSNLITYLTHSPGNPLLPSFPGAPFSPGGPGRPCLPVGSASSTYVHVGRSFYCTYVRTYIHMYIKGLNAHTLIKYNTLNMCPCTYVRTYTRMCEHTHPTDRPLT